MQLLWLPVIAYAALLLIVYFYQRRLIYFSTRFPVSVAMQLTKGSDFVPWKNSAEQIIGWKIPAKTNAIGSVLITHGNAGCALDRDYLMLPIHEAAALDVYVLEYPGYGAREGEPAMESFLAAGEEALNALPKELPVYLVSESIGAGVAAHLAKVQPSRIKGMAMFVPYDDLANVGQASMRFLPVKLLMRDRYRPALWLKDYRGPVKVILAGSDEVISVKFGQQLYDGYDGVKSLQLVTGARHNEVTEQSPEWWREVLSFWRQSDNKSQ
jgi:pimeloyl-ACP methyl ester carboxylesterase